MSTKEVHQQRRLLDELARARETQHTGAPPPTTVETGASAEQLAVDYLVAHGYGIVERNYRCDVGELDIVATDGAVMVFVEVRSRADDDHGDAIESVNRRKQRKVTLVAEVYLAHRRPPHDEFRFDVVAISGDHIELYEDAWRGGLL
jgi:putative endonuclease